MDHSRALRRGGGFGAGAAARLRDSRGLTILEALVGLALMALVSLGMTALAGATVKSKLIIAARTGNTETTRQTLEWMAERLRNAGLNLVPSEQPQQRCKDMVVATWAAMLPTASRVYVSGEILNSDAVGGNEVITIGYYAGADPQTGRTVVMESIRPCTDGPPVISPLSDPKITVTGLTFSYFNGAGGAVTALTDPVQIRTIRLIRITLTVQSVQGSSGLQTRTLTRDVMLRNPEPSANNWKNPNEAP